MHLFVVLCALLMEFTCSIAKTFHSNLEIAAGVEKQCHKVYGPQNIEQSNEFTVNTMIGNIHCSFCSDYIELLAAIHRLKHLITNTSTPVCID